MLKCDLYTQFSRGLSSYPPTPQNLKRLSLCVEGQARPEPWPPLGYLIIGYIISDRYSVPHLYPLIFVCILPNRARNYAPVFIVRLYVL